MRDETKAANNVISLCIRGMGDARWMLGMQIFSALFIIGIGYYLILCVIVFLTN